MPDCFEILHKDLAGRIGRLSTAHGPVETPALMPVVNPHLMTLGVEELRGLGAEILITNSYIISQDEDLKEKALIQGLHGMLEASIPVMTDSGAFQLSVYGSIGVNPLEILEFQQAIASDICVPLDIPTPPDVVYSRAVAELSQTETRLMEALDHRKKDLLLAGPIQGSTYAELREATASRLKDKGFDLYPIGGVVPLMEAYRFKDLVRVVAAAKKGLGPGHPVHLFGAGHPMVFALAAALGCDLFDSAAYALYARDGRYLTSRGTWHLDDLKYLPCSCQVCRDHTPSSLKASPDMVKLLAIHNISVSFQEMRLVKQHIWEGSLWELLECRARSHPRMLEAFRQLAAYGTELEQLDRISKSTPFYLSPDGACRPEVLRHGHRLERLNLPDKVLISDQEVSREERQKFDQVWSYKPPFGPYPPELAETYPLNAEVPSEPDASALETARENLRMLMLANPHTVFQIKLKDPKEAGT